MTPNGPATPASGSLDEVIPGTTPAAMPTPALITAMLDSGKGISDLVFSPGRPPQVEMQGRLTAVAIAEMPLLKPDDTSRIARDLVSNNAVALRTLKEQGACD